MIHNLLIVCQIVFWASAAGVVYGYVIYPALLVVLSRLFGRRPQPPQLTDDQLPRVALLIAAHNEQQVIAQRLDNALEMDYPRQKLRIVIGNDGSSDATAAIVASYASHGVELFDYPGRNGKATILNHSIARLEEPIIVLSDANTFFEPDALRLLARWFADPRVGSVCGKLVLTDPATGKNTDSLYWKYETFLKIREGRLGALLGSNGAIYAIRRELFQPIPANTVVDDFVIPLLAKLRSGCEIVYEQDAIAHELTPADISSEFNRRCRLGAGGFQSIGMLWQLLDPRRGWIALAFVSHKVIRWICPFFMIAMIVCNVPLTGRFVYQVTALMQIGFYLASLAAAHLPARLKVLKPLRLASMFTSMNAALFIGFWRWSTGLQKGTWRRTSRIAEAGRPA